MKEDMWAGYFIGIATGMLLSVPWCLMYKAYVDDEYNTRVEAFAYDQAPRSEQQRVDECLTILKRTYERGMYDLKENDK